MSYRLKNGEATNVMRFPATLDASEMVKLKPRLTRLLNQHPKILFLDLGATHRVELAGLGILWDRLKRFGNGYGSIRFSNASSRVHRTLARAGLENLLLS